MSLQPHPTYSVPDETARVAHAAFPKGNVYMRVFDKLGPIFTEQHFVQFFPSRGQPALSPVRLALTTLLQFAENLSDREAADAVRSRIDWKYILSLELTDSGFDHTVLSEYRTRLIEAKAEQLLFDTLLTKFQEEGFVKAGGRQRTDSTQVFAAIRTLNRLEKVGETLRHTLNVLALVVPEWLCAQIPESWWQRYSKPIDNYKLPKAEEERQALATQIGEDGFQLLDWLKQSTEMAWLNEIEAVKILAQVWSEQFTAPPVPVKLREVKEMPPAAQQIATPYDREARYATKRGEEWVGYKVHLTECCDEDRPHLITHVETTVATTPDDQVTMPIHQKLKAKALLPAQHIVDGGYTAAGIMVESQQHYQVEVIGPIAQDASWQAAAGEGFAKANFKLDWEAKKAICPAGKLNQQWKDDPSPTHPIRLRWANSDCFECELHQHCTKSTKQGRQVSLQPREVHEVMQELRQYQTTAEFRANYASRAGVEGTISQGVRKGDIRHARYIGLMKTHFQQLGTAASLNLVRLSEWLAGTPFAKARPSAFAALEAAA